MKPNTAAVAVILCGIVAVVGVAAFVAPAVRFRVEKERRHHQIGQLYNLARIYYTPAHGGHFPAALSDLKTLPQYGGYFEQASREIELTAPGVQQEEALPSVVAFKERTADRDGGRWLCSIDGSTWYSTR